MAKKATHSAYFEKAKAKYESGKWTAAMINTLVDAEKLTNEEAEEILSVERRYA